MNRTVHSLLVPRLGMDRALPLMCLHGAVPKLRDNFSFITSQCNSVFGNVREHHTEFSWFSCTSNSALFLSNFFNYSWHICHLLTRLCHIVLYMFLYVVGLKH